MALFLNDGFDIYNTGVNSDPWTIGPWTGQMNVASNIGVSTATTRFGVGKSYGANANFDYNGLYKTFPSNTSNTVYMSFALYPGYALTGSAVSGGYVGFWQGGTNQVQLTFLMNGTINVTRNGTTIATFTSAYTGQTWTHFQIRVVFNGSTGEVRIRKNGNTTDDFVATSLNTQATANAYADEVRFVSGNQHNSGFYFDDVLVYDSSGTAMNTWAGDVRCYTSTPSAAGSAADFTSGSNAVVVNSSGNSRAFTSNYTLLASFTTNAQGYLTKFTFPLGAAMTATVSMAIYSADTAGNPSTHIAGGSSIVNPSAGMNDFTFSSPPLLAANTKYWGAIATSTGSISGYYVGGNIGKSQSGAYSGTWPSGYGALGVDDAFMFYYTLGSLPNYMAVVSGDGDVTYNSSSTVNAHDLFAMSDLPGTPSSIHAVVQRVVARKTDSGTRTLQTEMKSGATTVQGTATALSSSHANIQTVYYTDPNTSSAWTASGVNALEAGYKINS